MRIKKEQEKNAAVEQFNSVTKFTTIVFIILSFYIMGTICNTVLFGSKNIVHVVAAILIFVIGTGINLLLYYKTDRKLLCYTGMGMYLILVTYLLFCGLNTSTYIYLFPALFLSIMFFRTRYAIIVSCIVTVVNFIDVVLLLQADQTIKFTLDTPYAVQLFGIVLCSILTCTVTRISKTNNDKVLHEAVEEKQKQADYAKHIVAIAEQIRNKVDTSDSIIKELNISNEVVDRAVKEISMSTKSNTESIMKQTQMTQSIQGIIDNTNEDASAMIDLASESKVAISEGLDVIDTIKGKSVDLVTANQQVSTVMENLETKMQEVQQITKIIYGVSSQTNLLALNASIEAARAGENGRSFAVVAEQIRQLADETRKSTESINALLDELNENTVNAKEASLNVQNITKEETNLIEHAETKFANINSVTKKLTELIEETSKKITDITEANNHIVDSITQLSATSEEVTASSDEAYELCRHNAECVEKETNLLREVNQLIRKFKL